MTRSTGTDGEDGDASSLERADEGAAAYAPRRASQSRFTSIRGLPYHIREWGSAQAQPLLLLHGARDASISFQFVVDALDDDWRIIAPDWRGHGQTSWTPGNYWLSDFLVDLDAIFDEFFPNGPALVVGHSMGANAASLYAGIRPQRVSRLLMLDAMGNPLDRSPVRIAEILADLLGERIKNRRPSTYSSPREMAAHLKKKNPRLDAARALYLAEVFAHRTPDGFSWPHDPTFRGSSPSLHSAEEWGECWGRIRAPVLCLISSDPRRYAATSDPEVVRARAAYFHDIAIHRVPETGHNIHHDAPAIVAQAIQGFMRATTPKRA